MERIPKLSQVWSSSLAMFGKHGCDNLAGRKGVNWNRLHRCLQRRLQSIGQIAWKQIPSVVVTEHKQAPSFVKMTDEGAGCLARVFVPIGMLEVLSVDRPTMKIEGLQMGRWEQT